MLSTHCRQFSVRVEKSWIRNLSAKPAPKSKAAFKEDGTHEDWDKAKPFSEIPGPKSYPLIGIAHEFIFGKFKNVSIPEMNNIMLKDYGTLCKLPPMFGRPAFVLAFNPDDVELVYRVEGPWPWRRSLETFAHYRKEIRSDVYEGTGGLLTEQGKEWQETRFKVNPAMMQPRMIKQYVTPVEEVVDEFITRMVKLRDANNEMPDDFSNELNKWALESIARIAMDTRLGCLKDDLAPDSDPQKMIEVVHDFFKLSYELEFLPSPWKYIRTPAYTKIMKAFDVMTDISLKYVDAAKKRIEENPNKSVDQESVLEKLLKIDRKVAIVMVMDMLFAGVDTTSATTSILLYYIATKPKIQEKLREEIKTILPNKDSKLAPDFINSIPYLKACMKESARISPIVTGTARKVPRDIVLGGYQIPKGTEVILEHMVLSNTESQFPKWNEFVPERWLTGRKTEEAAAVCPVAQDGTPIPSAKEAHPFSYMPFGFGPRMCIGRRFAELEMETFIVKLLRNYRIEWNYGPLKFKPSILNTPSVPLKYKMTEID